MEEEGHARNHAGNCCQSKLAQYGKPTISAGSQIERQTSVNAEARGSSSLSLDELMILQGKIKCDSRECMQVNWGNRTQQTQIQAQFAVQHFLQLFSR